MSSQRGNISRSRGQKHQNTTAFKNDKYGATTQVKVCQIQLCWAKKLFSLVLHFAFGPFYQIFSIFSDSPFQILLKVLWSKVWTCVCCEFFFLRVSNTFQDIWKLEVSYHKFNLEKYSVCSILHYCETQLYPINIQKLPE